jgi:hypothetical protein
MELAMLITAVALLVGAAAVPLGQGGRMSFSRALATLGQQVAAP